MKRPLLIGLSALGAIGLGLYLVRDTPVAPAPAQEPPAGPLPGGPLPLPGATTKLTSYLSDAFFRRVLELAAYFRSRGANVTAEDLLAVFMVESGSREHPEGVDPASVNGIGCVGLNQICGIPGKDPLSGLRAVGFQGTKDEYRALSGEEQLTYVQRYFDKTNGGRSYPQIQDYGTLYLVNFSPAFLDPPSSKVWAGRYPIMYRDPARGGTGPLDGNYTGNAGVDSGNKGYIEVADMAKFVKRGVLRSPAKWNELRMRLDRVRQAPPGNV